MNEQVPPCQYCDSRVVLERPEGWEPGDEQIRTCTKPTCKTNGERSLAGPRP